MRVTTPVSTTLRRPSDRVPLPSRLQHLLRPIALLAFLLAVVAGPVAPGLPSAHALDTGNLVVEDTAGVLYRPQLEQELRSVDFHQPTRVAIDTVRGQASGNDSPSVLPLLLGRWRWPAC